MFDYSGKKVILTGGASGVGAAAVEMIANLGCNDLTVLDVKEPTGPATAYIPTDMSDPDSIDAAIAEIGVGGGTIIAGRLQLGADGYSGEIGHIPVNTGPDATSCRCGSVGCLEAETGALALLALTGHQHTDHLSDAVRGIIATAAAGDEDVQRSLHEIGVRLGRGLAGMVNLLNPRRIVLGGYFADAFELATMFKHCCQLFTFLSPTLFLSAAGMRNLAVSQVCLLTKAVHEPLQLVGQQSLEPTSVFFAPHFSHWRTKLSTDTGRCRVLDASPYGEIHVCHALQHLTRLLAVLSTGKGRACVPTRARGSALKLRRRRPWIASAWRTWRHVRSVNSPGASSSESFWPERSPRTRSSI